MDEISVLTVVGIQRSTLKAIYFSKFCFRPYSYKFQVPKDVFRHPHHHFLFQWSIFHSFKGNNLQCMATHVVKVHRQK